MFKTDKAKTAGKFIIIMLCFAILFFLLLPFLEDPAQTAATQNKKASPQIFTSNPLTDLVRKVYAMFSKHSPRQAAQRVTDQELFVSSAEEAPLYAAAAPEQVPSAAGAAANSVENSSRGSSYFPEAYDNYGNAEFVNEEGEWVLVRQTAPDAGQRGMHDINSTDSAYDKWLQMERNAKYNPVIAKQKKDIPDSKLARLFQPIKKLFGGDSADSAGMEDAQNQKAFSLASARGERAQRRTSSYSGARRRPGIADLPAANLPSQVNAPDGQEPSLYDLLNPSAYLDGIAENLKEMADNNLSGKDKNEFNKFIDEQKQARQELIRQQLRNSILQDAQDQEPKELLSDTLLCSRGASGLYSQNPTVCPGEVTYVSDEQMEVMRSKGQQLASKAQKESLQELSALAGRPLKQDDMKMIVILGKTKGITNPIDETQRPPLTIPQDASEEEKAFLEQKQEERTRQDKLFKEFYDYMIQQKGCDSKECYWVATEYQKDPALRFTIQSSGMEFEGDPLSIHQTLTQGFLETKVDDESVNLQQLRNDLSAYNAYYIPYTKEDMDQLNQRNIPEKPNQKPQDAFSVFVPSAANAASMLEVLPNPGLVVYDNNEASILDVDGEQKTPQQKGERIRQLLVDRVKYSLSLMQKETQDLTKEGYGVLMRNSNDAIRKQIEKEGLGNMDSLMEFSFPKK